MHALIIFASGRGSNAQAIIDYFRKHPVARVALIVSNKADAGVLAIAEKERIPSMVVDRISFTDKSLAARLAGYSPSLLVLAGFLWKIPEHVLELFQDRIINIHPALLPDFGGRGMYGSHVHEAVLSAGKKESGITIHYVNEVYDSGDIIMQARCPVCQGDQAGALAARIHKLEHFFLPRTIEYLLKQRDEAERQY